MSNVLFPANTKLPAVMQTNSLVLSKIQDGAIGALHDLAIQELRQPVLSWYLAGINNRQVRRAIHAIRRSAKAHHVAQRGALAALQKKPVSFNIMPITIKGMNAVKHRAADVYNNIKSKFAAYRRKQG